MLLVCVKSFSHSSLFPCKLHCGFIHMLPWCYFFPHHNSSLSHLLLSPHLMGLPMSSPLDEVPTPPTHYHTSVFPCFPHSCYGYPLGFFPYPTKIKYFLPLIQFLVYLLLRSCGDLTQSVWWTASGEECLELNRLNREFGWISYPVIICLLDSAWLQVLEFDQTLNKLQRKKLIGWKKIFFIQSQPTYSQWQ